MIVLALLILLAVVCAYSWLSYKIKTMQSDIRTPVPKANIHSCNAKH